MKEQGRGATREQSGKSETTRIKTKMLYVLTQEQKHGDLTVGLLSFFLLIRRGNKLEIVVPGEKNKIIFCGN